jgi:hypothetical protein
MKLFYLVFNLSTGQYEKFYSSKEAEDFVNNVSNQKREDISLGLDRGDYYTVVGLPDEYVSYKDGKIVLAEIEN